MAALIDAIDIKRKMFFDWTARRSTAWTWR